MTTAAHEQEYLSVSEVALRLGVSAPTIRRRIEDGELPAVQLGGRGCAVRVPADALRATRREAKRDWGTAARFGAARS